MVVEGIVEVRPEGLGKAIEKRPMTDGPVGVVRVESRRAVLASAGIPQDRKSTSPEGGVTAIPPSGGGLVEGRLFSLDAVLDEVIPFAV